MPSAGAEPLAEVPATGTTGYPALIAVSAARRRWEAFVCPMHPRCSTWSQLLHCTMTKWSSFLAACNVRKPRNRGVLTHSVESGPACALSSLPSLSSLHVQHVLPARPMTSDCPLESPARAVQ